MTTPEKKCCDKDHETYIIPDGFSLRYGQPDYHQRFRERFGEVRCAVTSDPDQEFFQMDCVADILAFIDEVVAEQETKAAIECVEHEQKARAEERANLIEKVEGVMLENPGEGDATWGYNRALEAVLTYLRGEEKPFKDLGEFAAAPPEKKKGVMLEVAREATNEQRAQIGLPPLQEETECCDLSFVNPRGFEVADETLKSDAGCCPRCTAFRAFPEPTFGCLSKSCPCHKPRTEECA